MLEKLLIFLDCPLVVALLLFLESDVVHVSLSALFSWTIGAKNFVQFLGDLGPTFNFVLFPEKFDKRFLLY